MWHLTLVLHDRWLKFRRLGIASQENVQKLNFTTVLIDCTVCTWKIYFVTHSFMLAWFIYFKSKPMSSLGLSLSLWVKGKENTACLFCFFLASFWLWGDANLCDSKISFMDKFGCHHPFFSLMKLWFLWNFKQRIIWSLFWYLYGLANVFKTTLKTLLTLFHLCQLCCL